ncbi:ferritin [bacterium]|nr:ferritin [bacterium]
MLSKSIEEALNNQLNAEFAAAYLYLSMSAWFESIHLKGFGGWLNAQFDEEQAHASKFYHFILDRGGKVVLQAMDAPRNEWDSPLAAIEDALSSEKQVTKSIHNLKELADAEKDHATSVMLQWFITEQVEEEDTFDSIVEQLKMIDDSKAGMYLFDSDMGKRPTTVISG